MESKANIPFGDQSHGHPAMVGTGGEQAIDLRISRAESGSIRHDQSYGKSF